MEGMDCQSSRVIRVAAALILCISMYASDTRIMVMKIAAVPNPTDMRVAVFKVLFSPPQCARASGRAHGSGQSFLAGSSSVSRPNCRRHVERHRQHAQQGYERMSYRLP